MTHRVRKVAYVGGLLLASVPARAEPTKEQCVAANEGGQDLRREGRLRAAIERFEACAALSCPGPVREDCVKRRDEAQHVAPSVDFTVADPDGHAIPNLELRIDDVPTSSLTKLAVEPGDHVFEFRARSFVSVRRRLNVRVGDRIHEDLVMRQEARTGASAGVPSGVEDGSVTAKAGSSRRTLAYVLGGVGIVAIGVGVGAGVVALNAASDRDRACGPQFPACADASRAGEVKDLQDTITTTGNISTVAFIGGAALVAASLWLYLTSPVPTRGGLQRWERSVALGTLGW